MNHKPTITNFPSPLDYFPPPKSFLSLFFPCENSLAQMKSKKVTKQ